MSHRMPNLFRNFSNKRKKKTARLRARFEQLEDRRVLTSDLSVLTSSTNIHTLTPENDVMTSAFFMGTDLVRGYAGDNRPTFRVATDNAFFVGPETIYISFTADSVADLGSQIDRAVLTVESTAGGFGADAGPAAPFSISAHAVNADPFTEITDDTNPGGAISWSDFFSNNILAADPDAITVVDNFGSFRFDVTSLVQDWASGANTHFVIALTGTNDGSGSDFLHGIRNNTEAPGSTFLTVTTPTTYTVTVANDGPDDATGVSISDVVPDYFGVPSAISNGGTVVNGNDIEWTGLTIPAGSSVDLTYQVAAAVPGSFIAPAEDNGAWNRPSTSNPNPNASFQGWETFGSPSGPNAPQSVPLIFPPPAPSTDGAFGGGLGVTWDAINPGGTADAFDSSAAFNMSLITSGGNIYSFAAPVTPRIVVPNNIDGVAGDNPAGYTTILVQVRSLGNVLDADSVTLDGSILPTEYALISRVEELTFGGLIDSWAYEFVVPGNADEYTIDLSGAGSSFSFDRAAVDTIWNPTATSPAEAYTVGAPLNLVNFAEVTAVDQMDIDSTANNSVSNTPVEDDEAADLFRFGNTPPRITSDGGGATASTSVGLNITNVTTVTAVDPQVPSLQYLDYSISGDDAAFFNISPAGVLTFITAPDFNAPADLDMDNVYEVTVTVRDNGVPVSQVPGGTLLPGLSDSQAISVTVTGVVEMVDLSITKDGSNIHTVAPQEDVMTSAFFFGSNSVRGYTGDDRAVHRVATDNAFGVGPETVYISFTADTIASLGSQIDRAVLTVESTGGGFGGDAGPAAPFTISAHAVNANPLTEITDDTNPGGTINWLDFFNNNILAADPDAVTVVDNFGAFQFDVTGLVQDWASGANTHFVIALTGKNDTSGGDFLHGIVNNTETPGSTFLTVNTPTTYTVTVSNEGPDEASGVTISDVVPDYFGTPTAISNGGTVVNGNDIEWTGLIIPAGGSIDLTYQVSAASAGGFIAPTASNGAWDRPTAGNPNPNATFQAWESFGAPGGPNFPAAQPGPEFGGIAGDSWSAINPGGMANAYDGAWPASGSFPTSGGNIYSPSAPVAPRIEIPNNIDGIAGDNPDGYTTILVQVKGLGTEIDPETALLNGSIPPTESALVSRTGSGFGGTDSWAFEWRVPGNADLYTVDFAGSGAHFSLDRVAVDTIWNPNANIDASAFTVGAPLNVVNFAQVTAVDQLDVDSTANNGDPATPAAEDDEVFAQFRVGNTPPRIASNGGGSSAATTVLEGTTAVTSVTVLDPEVPASQYLTYSVSGVDAAVFNVSPTGELTFITAPDFGVPTDADGDNVYHVTVTAEDSGVPELSDSQDLVITVEGSGPDLYINEILLNPEDGDYGREYIELRQGASSTIDAATYLVAVDGNERAIGRVTNVFDLSGLTFGTGGFLTLLQAGNPYAPVIPGTSNTQVAAGPGWEDGAGGDANLQNNSTSYLLISASVPPAVGDDWLTDVLPNSAVGDSIAFLDADANDQAFGGTVFINGTGGKTDPGASVVRQPFTAEYLARDGDTSGVDAAADWVAGEVDVNGLVPNYIVNAGNVTPASRGGELLDHIGSTNFELPINLILTGGSNDVTEGLGTDSFDLSVNVLPTDDLFVTLDGHDQVEFSANNGAFSRTLDLTLDAVGLTTIDIRAVDDALSEGPHSTIVDVTIASADIRFDGLNLQTDVSITDNEPALGDLVINDVIIHAVDGTSLILSVTVENQGPADVDLNGPTGGAGDNVRLEAYTSADDVHGEPTDVFAFAASLGTSPLPVLSTGDSYTTTFSFGNLALDLDSRPILTLAIDSDDVVEEGVGEGNNTTAYPIVAEPAFVFDTPADVFSGTPGSTIPVTLTAGAFTGSMVGFQLDFANSSPELQLDNWTTNAPLFPFTLDGDLDTGNGDTLVGASAFNTEHPAGTVLGTFDITLPTVPGTYTLSLSQTAGVGGTALTDPNNDPIPLYFFGDIQVISSNDSEAPTALVLNPGNGTSTTNDLGYVDVLWSDAGVNPTGIAVGTIHTSNIVIAGGAVSIDQVTDLGNGSWRYTYDLDGDTLPDNSPTGDGTSIDVQILDDPTQHPNYDPGRPLDFVVVTDGAGNVVTGQTSTFTYDGTLPSVQGVSINPTLVDPDDLPIGPQPTSWAQQRSDIREIQIVFNEVVTLDVGNIALTNLGVDPDNDADTRINLAANQVSVDGNVVTIDPLRDDLGDGVYQLDIVGATDRLGNVMEDYSLSGTTGEPRLHEFQGDWNGDGAVTIFDFNAFAYWFGHRGPEYIDLNSDNGISIFDFALFRQQFAQRVTLEDAPEATDDTVLLDTNDFDFAIDVLANDLPAGGLTLISVSPSQINPNADVWVDTANNLVGYESADVNAGWTGTDTFTYVAEDADGVQVTGTVNVVITDPVPRGLLPAEEGDRSAQLLGDLDAALEDALRDDSLEEVIDAIVRLAH